MRILRALVSSTFQSAYRTSPVLYQGRHFQTLRYSTHSGSESLSKVYKSRIATLEASAPMTANPRTAANILLRERSFNFSAGPAGLPENIMKKVQAEFCNYEGWGMGMVEMRHREVGGPVHLIIKKAEIAMRTLLNVPENYEVLFFHGGAHGQYAAIALNLLRGKKDVSFVNTGYWANRTMEEVSKHCKIHIAASSEESNYTEIPHESTWKIHKDSAFTHIVSNETMNGLEFQHDPDIGDGVLVADMTSNLLSRPVDVKKYGLIYASFGKNLGPAGAAVAIVRKDLIHSEHPKTPGILSYKAAVASKPFSSIHNTPPVFPIYVGLKMWEDLIEKGGLEKQLERSRARAQLIFDVIDSSDGFYKQEVSKSFRSLETIPFRINGGDAYLEALFNMEAAKQDLFQLDGHPDVGGKRITLYNDNVPLEGVETLARFMEDFKNTYQEMAKEEFTPEYIEVV